MSLLKIVIIGDSGVGKTSLTNVFIFNKLNHTVDSDFLTKEVKVDDHLVNIHVWESKESLGEDFYRGVDGCILCFDLNNVHTLDHLDSWHEKFLSTAAPEDEKFPFVVLGNKIDLKPKQEVSHRALSWCQKKRKYFIHRNICERIN